MLVAQDIQGSCLEDKMASLHRRKFQPAGDQDTQYMAVGEKHDIIVDRLGSGDDAVATLGNLIGSFTAGGGAGKNRPGRVFLANLLGRDSLVLAVVPLSQVIRDLGAIDESCQFARALGAGSGTAKNEIEVPPREFVLQCRGLTLTLKGEGDVAVGSVSAVLAPLRFTVTYKDNLWT